MLQTNMILTLKLLFLLMVANGAPILLRKVMGRRGAWPVDGGVLFRDGRPVLGPSKTWRGVLAGILATGPAALAIGLPLDLGFLFGGCAMLGDLLSSFVKRRLGIPSSGMAIGLDQVPEALFPLFAVSAELALEPGYSLVLAMAFLLLELGLSRILYALHIREHPH